jgi:glutamyl/glutaminyl-tRNA synthetase
LRSSREGVYPGTCRERGLSLDADEVAWRLRTEDGMVLRVKGFPAGEIEARLPAEMRDFVVRKKDGFPAYQLSSVVDDLHYGVDLIIRGQDLWASTLAQLNLSYPLDAPAFRDIRFYHHPLLTSPLGEKLSKSAGSTSIQYLRRQGLKAADVYAMIARAYVGSDPLASAVRDWAGLAALVLDAGDDVLEI